MVAGVILLITAINACQYPVDTSTLPEGKQFLIIDAELTEDYGKVTVNYTLKDVTAQGNYLFPDPPNAVAYVLDSHGNRTDFIPDGSKNTSFKGIVGETYKLYVEADGRSYESKAETMPACPELDSLSPVYTRETFRDPGDLFYDGFDVYAQLTDDPTQENYYQWDWIHYERRFSCDVIIENGMEVLVPCTPYDCWGIEYNTRIVVQSDKLRNGQPIAQRVVRVPFATPPNKYYLRVEQRSITPTVYTYLKSLETQTQNVGSLFDIPAQTKFSPNISNINDPSEQIIGVFSVFSSRHKIIYIDMQQIIPGA
ncbi:MAG TPA: DUF4249 domain-containing protein, partial [Saprospiraceae bacterium]|nr:DUF4249 domain-containing protein [Saprospiraceae bacterium]